MLMQVKKSKLVLEGEGTVDIINVKCEPDMVGVLIMKWNQKMIRRRAKEKNQRFQVKQMNK